MASIKGILDRKVLAEVPEDHELHRAFKLYDWYKLSYNMPFVQETLVLARLKDEGIVDVEFAGKELAVLKAFRGETKTLWTRVGADIMKEFERGAWY